jgi:hypothetical protein
MSIKGFNVNGVTEQYDYNSLDNKPEIHSIPTGGTAGQVLAKTSGADYAVGWVNQTGGGGGGDIIVDSALSTTSENPVQNKVVTTAINAKYTKPAYGIPATDMTSAVQASLAKADTALQTAPVTSVNGQTGAVTVQAATDAQVETAVDAWLGENVTQETGYVLDSTLTMDNAAPPASAVGELKSAIHLNETDYSSFVNDTASHTYATKRQFYPEIVPKNSYIRTASIPIANVGGGALLNAEVWEITDGNTLSRVKTVSTTPTRQTTNVIDIAYQTANKRCYVAIYFYNCQLYNVPDATKTLYYDPENNADAVTLSISSLGTTTGRAMTGGIAFTTVTLESEKEYRLPVKWRQGTMSNGNAYFTMNGCVTDYMVPTSICDELRPLANTHTLSVNYYDYADGVYSFSNRVQFAGTHTIDKTHDYFVVNIFKSWSVQTLVSECDSIIGLYVTLPITEYTKSIIESGYHNVPQFNKNDVWSMAHQGYSTDGANHNKKGGYARAASRGFTHGECDVRLTADGIPVCCHDDTFTDATTSETVTISSKTYAELTTYNYYGGTIATLEEIIAECKQSGLQLEIDQMSSSNISEVTDVVSKMSAWDVCIFAVNWMNQYPDLAPFIANGIKAVNPNARFLVGYNGFTDYDAAIEFTKTLDNPVFAVGQYTNSNLNTLKTIATELAGSARLHIWTVDNIGHIKEALPYINGWTSNAISGDDIFNPSKGSGLKL